MNRYFKKFLLKITILTSFLVFAFVLGTNIINAFFGNNDDTKNIPKTNSNTFQNVDNPILGKTGVALSTNIGTRFKQMKGTPVDLFGDVIKIGELIQNNDMINLDGGLISKNMEIIKEYRNVLKTDFKGTLNQSYDRYLMLNAIVSQLQYRYDIGQKQVKYLVSQRSSFENEMKNLETQINSLKTKLNLDFQKYQVKETYENIEKYLELRNKVDYARTYIIFSNQFISDYNMLNVYTNKLLETLVKNKDAIIKDSYIVIPEGGVNLLKEYNLLYD